MSHNMKHTDGSEFRHLTGVSAWAGDAETYILGEIDGDAHIAYNLGALRLGGDYSLTAERAARELLETSGRDYNLTAGMPWNDDENEFYATEEERTYGIAWSTAGWVLDQAEHCKLRYLGGIGTDQTHGIEED